MGQMALKLLCWVSLIDLTSSDLIYLINLLFLPSPVLGLVWVSVLHVSE